MLTREITYTNQFTGKEQTETFYFNLTKAELVFMQGDFKNGMTGFLETLVATKDQNAIIELFKNFIERSYGVRTPDGSFIKSKEEFQKFACSEAYSVLFMELSTNAEAGIAFINGVVPKDLLELALTKQDLPSIN